MYPAGIIWQVFRYSTRPTKGLHTWLCLYQALIRVITSLVESALRLTKTHLDKKAQYYPVFKFYEISVWIHRISSYLGPQVGLDLNH